MADQVIAIDGPAASGKSTVASHLARLLHIPYINTGNMYRAVTYYLQQKQVALTDADAVKRALQGLNLTYQSDGADFALYGNEQKFGAELRSPEVAAQVSVVAALPVVRAFLKNMQQQSVKLGLIVMEGRDIGTEIFPQAKWKFFVTARPEVRAARRLAQSGENFDGATLQKVAAAIAERDRIDSNRAVAPLKQAPDAELIDTSDLTIEQVVAKLAEQVRR